MICTAIKSFNHNGKNHAAGSTPNFPSQTCKELVAKGLVSLTGLPPENPPQAAGRVSMSSASPAVQASGQVTSNGSADGDGLTAKQRKKIKQFRGGSS